MSLPSVNVPHDLTDKILKLMVTMTRSKLKSRLKHVSHLQPLSNVPTKCQPPTLNGFRDITGQNFKGGGLNGKIKSQIKVTL